MNDNSHTKAAERNPGSARAGDLVSVIITCFNQAHFLAEAIESVLVQTYRHFEIIVVDDGSTDNTSQIVARYPIVHYVYQKNQGLSAGRNTGIKKSQGAYVVFLDADDRLLHIALEAGLESLSVRPECAFVAGRYTIIQADGSLKSQSQRRCVEKDHYVALLAGNYIGMHATVMYRRTVFDTIGWFDTSLKACEDYDLYLRIARTAPVYCHERIVAEYRRHQGNMSSNRALMLQSSVKTLRSQRKYVVSQNEKEAFRTGVQFWQNLFGDRLLREVQANISRREWRSAIGSMLVLLQYHPLGLLSLGVTLSDRVLTGIARYVLRSARAVINRTAGMVAAQLPWAKRHKKRGRPAVGQVRFGDLRRCTPISRRFSFDRGLPIDRYYIERFLAGHANDIRGDVLEIGDDTYTKRFGAGRVVKSDVFHVTQSNPNATIVGDLTCADHVPSYSFDCVILTQTLHLIYDVRAALKTIYRILKPGGVLLATFPGVTQMIRDCWQEYWCWSFTSSSARRLFAEIFPSANVTIDVSGNVLTASAFLYGLATEELQQDELDYRDPDYEVSIMVRAVKPT